MNFTACIKSARIKPNYVLNVSIDIPLKSAKMLSDRSRPSDIAFSPNRINLNKKIKLSLPSSSLPKTSRDVESRKISSCMGETQHTISGAHKRRTVQTINSYQKREKQKNKSCEVSPKRKTSTKSQQKKRKAVVSNKSIFNSKLPILNKFVNESEDNMIKYTNESAELKKDPSPQLVKKHESQFEDFDVSEIREFQKIATQRKQHLNYLYIKEKVLVLASVKKIQRAWRNYKTKKLIRSYSSNISLKFSSKVVNPLPNKNILTVRSLESNFRRPKKQLSSIEEIQVKQQEEKNIQTSKSKKQSSREESLKEFQMEQIKKWQELINQIRTGKKIEDVLQNSFKRKTQLQKDLQKYQNEESYSWSNSFQYEKSKQQKGEEGMTTEERRKKLQFFQSEIRKIDNENSDFNSISQFQYVEINKASNKANQELENQKLKRKLQIFSQQFLGDMEKKQKKQTNSPSLDELQKSNVKIEMEESSSQEKLQTHRVNVLQEDEREKSPLQKHFPEEQRRPKISELDKQFLINIFLDELVIELFLEMPSIHEFIHQIKNSKDFSPSKVSKAQTKPEGICTNLESIKDYLQNLVAYIFQQHGNLLPSQLLIACGPTPQMLFRYVRDEPTNQSVHTFVLPEELFEEHWAYASQQIYFDTKYEDSEQEKRRVAYLKNLTRIYFRAIFDGFNQCLEPFRLYGLLGKPYPWKNQSLSVKAPDARKTVKGAYKKLSSLAMVFCGLHLDDKRHTMSESMIKQIQNERMNTLLEMQLSSEEYRWGVFDDEEAEVLINLSDGILLEMMKEALCQFNIF